MYKVKDLYIFLQFYYFYFKKGIELPDVAPDKEITTEVFLSLMVKLYEAFGGEIDISKVNPRITQNDIVKKITLINVYENFFIIDNTLDSKVDHGTAAYWLMKLQDAVQNRLYWKNDKAATMVFVLNVDIKNRTL